MSDGEKVVIKGRALECYHCGSHHFDRREAQLHTAGMTFLKLEWLNKTAEVFVCVQCGRLEWFLGV